MAEAPSLPEASRAHATTAEDRNGGGNWAAGPHQSDQLPHAETMESPGISWQGQEYSSPTVD